MIKKTLILICMLIFSSHVFSSNPGPTNEVIALALNHTVGTQLHYSSKGSYSFSCQGNLLLLNYGYVYQPNVKGIGYVGVSTYFLPFAPIIYLLHDYNSNDNVNIIHALQNINVKIQYGKIFSTNQDLLKVSFDYFLSPISNGYKGLTSYSTVGIFVEKNFGKGLSMNGYSFGISLNWSIWDIFIIKDKKQKYFRKYNL